MPPDLAAPSAWATTWSSRRRGRPSSGPAAVCGRCPTGHVLGVPVGLGPLARSGVVPPLAVARAGLDLVLPRPGRFSADPTVAEVIGRRMGRGVLDRLVEPLVGGINAGRADGLSLAATAPQLAEAATGSRSLVLGLRRRRRSSSVGRRRAGVPGDRGGMERLVDRLQSELAAAGVDDPHGVTVRAVEPDGAGRATGSSRPAAAAPARDAAPTPSS